MPCGSGLRFGRGLLVCPFPPGHYRLAGGCVKDALRAPLRNAAELGADLPGQGGHACGVAAGVVAGPLVDRGDP
jgi:hypothetical protein